jgi:hypothetical protein
MPMLITQQVCSELLSYLHLYKLRLLHHPWWLVHNCLKRNKQQGLIFSLWKKRLMKKKITLTPTVLKNLNLQTASLKIKICPNFSGERVLHLLNQQMPLKLLKERKSDLYQITLCLLNLLIGKKK